jgi:hypothetical protein
MTITGTPFLLLDRELARSNVRADAEKVRGLLSRSPMRRSSATSKIL